MTPDSTRRPNVAVRTVARAAVLALAALAPAAVTLAETEGLEAHGRSVSIRLNR